jgi:hypothetical protein
MSPFQAEVGSDQDIMARWRSQHGAIVTDAQPNGASAPGSALPDVLNQSEFAFVCQLIEHNGQERISVLPRARPLPARPKWHKVWGITRFTGQVLTGTLEKSHAGNSHIGIGIRESHSCLPDRWKAETPV